MPLFPIFVKLDGRPCLVVGAGPVAESKIDALLSAGASLTIVAPVATPGIQNLAATGRVQWHERTFQSGDLNGVALVVAAVPADVAADVFREARSRGVLCNSVDDPHNCDFYYPAVVNRGDLQIAISTAGHSPAFAQHLRRELERQFGPEYARWIQRLGETRRALFAAPMDAEVRKAALHQAADQKPQKIGMVFLVGAGPGDPELLTLKAVRVLGHADVVLHDDLLTPEILEFVPATAGVECVGKRHNERQVSQAEINRRMCSYACAGKTVVRLKGGDGAIFGRASEELDALVAANIPFTIVPGVTAASGAAAAARVSLTDRRLGSAFTFVTAQRCKGNPPPDWRAIAALGGTIAIYMPGGHEAELSKDLMVAGLPSSTSCFVVSQATRPGEQVIETTIGGLPDAPRLPSPALLLVGALGR